MSTNTSFHDNAATPTKAMGWITRSAKKPGSLMANFITRLVEQRLHRLAEQQLQSAPSHMLRDIGIIRSQIPYLVRFDRPMID